ncbi:hypothetical protein A4G19_06190 [Pasteurellaceae bacterium Macca]|nr:hypothetical protein [Pasteurellaceae bacterium Macca]
MMNEATLDKFIEIRYVTTGGQDTHIINDIIQNQILKSSDIGKAEFIAIEEELSQNLAEKHILAKFDEQSTLNENSLNQMIQALQGADIAVILADLSSQFSSTIAPIVAKIAKEQGILTLVIATESASVEQSTQQTLDQIAQHADSYCVLPYQAILADAPKNTTLQGVFKHSKTTLSQLIHLQLSHLLHSGIIGINFADYQQFFHNLGQFYVGIGEGHEQAEEAVKMAIHNLNRPLTQSTHILCLINHAANFDLFELTLLMDKINDMSNLDAMFLLSGKGEDDLGDKIQITLLAN